jgi:hypothetical protein
MKLQGMLGVLALAALVLVPTPAQAAGGKGLETFTTKSDFDT